MHHLQIQPVSAATRTDWIKLRHELWPDCPLARHELEIDQLLAGTGIVALAWINGTAVGFAEVSIRADHVEGTSTTPVHYLEGWYVRESHRGTGVGRALINFIEKWSLDHGFTELASDAELEDALSIKLHDRLGFREVGRTVHFVKPIRQPAD
jgi:aminoglycoside 6'-N-acetyltransferase I